MASTLAWTSVQQPPASGTASGGLTLAGHVMSPDPNPSPVRSATVTATDVSGRTPPRTTETDENGRFTFTALAPGRYDVTATKGGYLRTSFGMVRPERTGTPVTVSAGQPVTNITLRMWRGAVITGMLLDPRGRPLSGAPVSIRRFQFLNGVRTIATATVGSSTTDDRGLYRIFGLPPGDYAVFTSSSALGRGMAATPARQTTNEDIERALRGARGGRAAPGAATVPAVAAPPVLGYAPVYYPGTAIALHATPVHIEAGEERAGVDFAVLLVPIATVSGAIVPPAGVALAGLQLIVTLLAQSAPADLVLSRSSTVTNPNGTFTLSSVAPGDYVLTVRAVSTDPGGRAGWWASTPVSVNGVDVTGVSLTLEPAGTVTGQVIFDGARPPADEGLSVTVRLTPRSRDQSAGPALSASALGPQGRFTIAGVAPGEYMVSATAVQRGTPLAGWRFAGASLGAREVSDRPVSLGLGSGTDALSVRFVDRQTELTGFFQDAAGRPAPDYFIVAFPADRIYWLPASRRIVQARPATDGRFTIIGLPAGDYVVAATTDLVAGDLADPVFLDQLLAAAAVKVSLRDGATVTQDIRIAAQ